jgi:hypothetical protein
MGKSNIVQATVGRHATAAFALIVVLLLLVIYFWNDMTQWREAAKAGRTTKDPFGVAPYNNLNMGGNNPMWYLGSDHAGWGGSVMRDSTDYHVAEYTPEWRAGAVVTPPREGMTSARGALKRGARGARGYGPCGAFQTAVTVHDPDGTMITRCHNDDVGPARVCNGWNPAATVEAAALATVGGLKHEPRADSGLQRAINSAYDTSDSMTDEQLERLMHQGGTP